MKKDNIVKTSARNYDRYIKNSVENLKYIAKENGLKVKFEDKILGFTFSVYKPMFFGLYNKLLKVFIGIWSHEEDFDEKWKETHEYIKNYKDE